MKVLRAFTVVEILIVLAIVAFLAAIVVPLVLRAKKGAKEVPDVSNMRQVYIALTLYESDNNENPPGT